MGKKPKAAKAAAPAPAGDDDEGGGSNWVYVRDKKFAWLPASLISQDGKEAKVKVYSYKDEESIASDCGATATSSKDMTVKLKDYDNASLPLQNIKGTEFICKEDMVDLPFLHEAAILFNVKARLNDALCYTRTGDIVIAVNPYKWLTHLYVQEEQVKYAAKLVWEPSPDGDPRKFVAPHVYEISSLCYKGLASNNQDQSILVSGESGAGKTETVKICMNHIAAIQQGPVTDATKEQGQNIVVQRILDSNPLLEAYGNAKTPRNDNSSRFGKYINLQFCKKEALKGIPFNRWDLAGSKCEVYLLEKSRVTGHEDSEGTYHIFYQMLGATDEIRCPVWGGLKGANYDTFKNVRTPPYTRMIEGMTDGENYEATVKSLALIHVEGDKLMTLMRAIVITLCLCNVRFEKDPKDDEKSVISTRKDFDDAQGLLGIDAKQLELAFIEKTVTTAGETFKVPLKQKLAAEGCSAFAKEIYARTFLWLVREINSATCAEENYEGGGQTDFGMIGLLDIFGFESFKVNGFEQLSINYANEKLQQKFTKDIFEAVQIEYEAEGIDLNQITYDDNSDVLEVIEGKKGSLIKTLNEECVRPGGNDEAFVSKSLAANKKAPCFFNDAKGGPLAFGIHHYAGKVVYHAEGFVARNVDTLPFDLSEAAKTSINEIIAKHLENDAMTKSEMKDPEPAGKGKKKGGPTTIWTKFKGMLSNLMTNLATTSSRYIRCLKPNTDKKPLKMYHMSTIEQLRCAGVVAAVTISRSAFPTKMGHEECVRRFLVMRPKGAKTSAAADDWVQQTIDLLDPVLDCKAVDGVKAYVMGKTKVYFRVGAMEYMEQARGKHISRWVIELQRFGRGYNVRKNLKKLRMMGPVPNSTKISSWYKMLLQKREFKKALKKKRKAEKGLRKMNRAATFIQSYARRYLARKVFDELLKEFKEKGALKQKIKEMENKQAEADRLRQKELDDAKEAAEREIKEYKDKAEEELRNTKNQLRRAAQQQTLIDEGGKIIEFLRKENMKIRNQIDTVRKENKGLKENNARLMEANASASQSFTQLNDHAKQLNQTNAKLLKNVDAYKQQKEKLKEDLKTRHQYFVAESEARLSYQKTMAFIVTTIQDQCRDPKLAEDVVIMALECEAMAKQKRDALDKMAAEKAAAEKAAAEKAAADKAAAEKAAADKAAAGKAAADKAAADKAAAEKAAADKLAADKAAAEQAARKAKEAEERVKNPPKKAGPKKSRFESDSDSDSDSS